MRRLVLVCALLAVTLSAGCQCGSRTVLILQGDAGGDAGSGCSDADGDGYGVGPGCLGEDCDDSDNTIHSEADCVARCEDDPHATGCPCDEDEFPDAEDCYGGPPETRDVGECRGGTRVCRGGAWGPCQDQVLPEDEFCNERDDDCDGSVDDGVQNTCGNCEPGCEQVDIGNDDDAEDDWELDEDNSGGVVEDENGDLTLGRSSSGLHLIWVNNSLQGTISKINTETREELARYRTGPLGVSGGYWSGPGDNPSRTSVNYLGDAYVANRSFGGQPSATKIHAIDCPDQDGDGAVSTSSAFDDVLPWGEDECVAWNTPVGNNNGIARAIVVEERVTLDGTLEEHIWVGNYNDRAFYELDGDTGAASGLAVDVTVNPYGGAIDRDSNLWCASLSSRICRFNTLDPDDKEVIDEGGQNYGITIDSEGNVWTGGSNVTKYVVAERRFEHANGFASQGIAADAEGWVWTHHDSGNGHRIAQDDLANVALIPGQPGRGVAIDFHGLVWFINWARAGSDGDITVIDPAEALPADRGSLDICCDTIVSSYTYSDMTGLQLRYATVPIGNYDITVEGCPPGEDTTWTHVDWEGSTPEGTFLRFQVRAGNSIPEVTAKPWVDAAVQPPDAPPVAIGAALGADASAQILQLRVIFITNNPDEAPVLHLVGVRRTCGGVVG